MKRLIIFFGTILILATGLAGCGQDDGNAEADGDDVASAPTATLVDQVFDNVDKDDIADQAPVLYEPVVIVATNTPPAVTNTPEATDTPQATITPEATAVPPTNTPAPIPPTNPPPPPPTAVPPTEPPPPPPPAIGARGLVASHFAVQPRAELFPKGAVWFEFTVANSTGGEVPFHSLGVMPRKDGVDRSEWYQQSWKGKNSTIKPEGINWEDNIKLPEEGDYTLRLVICFDNYESCTNRGGPYETLSHEIPITIKNQ